jgi:ACS family tartrate transporter-like MFS transporter
LQSEAVGKGPKHDRSILMRVLRSPYVWVMGLFYLLTLGSNYAVAFSLPVVLRAATGLDAGRVGWIVAGYGVVGAAAMVVLARSSDKRGERRWHVLLPACLMAVALAAAALGLQGWVAVGALLVSYASFCGMQGPLLSLWPSLAEVDCTAVAIAVINVFGIAGGFVGPYWMGYMHDATHGYAAGIASLSGAVVVAALSAWSMMRRFARVPGRDAPTMDALASF